MAGTSPTRVDRRHRPRAEVGPLCRPSCPRRTPDCASRMSRPPGRRPRGLLMRQIGRAHELQSHSDLVCRLLLETSVSLCLLHCCVLYVPCFFYSFLLFCVLVNFVLLFSLYNFVL